MSESQVDASHVEEIGTQVLTQFVTRQDGGDEDHMSVELLQEQVDLQEYGVTKKWVIITDISKEVENNSHKT